MDITLILSVIIFCAAPLLARLVSRLPVLHSAFDGFVLVTILGLVTLTLLPEALAYGGLISFFIVIAGFILPWLSERLFHNSEEMTHRVLLLIASLALVIHAASDGAILAFVKDQQDRAFIATGILLHRAGVAVAVWWMLRPILSTKGGIIALTALGLVTIVGYMLALYAGDWYDMPIIGYWQAFAAGSLMHVVMHPIEENNHSHTVTTSQLPSSHQEIATPKSLPPFSHRIGTALGILFVIGLINAHYLHHAPGDVTVLSNHNTHHAIDLMMLTGQLTAPILLLIILVGGALSQVREHSYRAIFDGAVYAAPWSLVVWLGATIVAELSPITFPVLESGQLLFTLWAICIGISLVYLGARNFLAPLMPNALLHTHSH